MGRHRKTAAKHLTAGVDSSVYADFAPGDRVRVKEGLLGVVTAVEDGPFPGTEQYQVTLDDGMGGGTWGAGEVVAAGPTTASVTEAMVVEAMPFEAAGLTTAASDYPELADILVDRPPLPHSEPMRMHAAKDDRFDGVSVKQDDDGYYVTTHRARSDSYESAEAIPQKDVDFIESTGSRTSGDFKACDRCGSTEVADLEGSKQPKCASCGFHLALSDSASKEAAADQHVLISTASLWDRVVDTTADFLNSQMAEEFKVKDGTSLDSPRGNWCRFLKAERCYFPKVLDEEGTAKAGYAVWVPEDRGRCPRNSWDLQKKCPVSEPGPASGDSQARVDATVRWQDGGQRMPAGWVVSDADFDRSRVSSLQAQSAFEFTASWSDVRAKAKRIRSEGGVRIISAPQSENDLTVTAEVKGDSEVYETTLLREPGKKNVASWSCGCAWSSYSWGRSGRWKKYEGRMCSHALAVQFEAQAQGMGGGRVKVQPQTPPWRVNKNPFEYAKAASLRPVCLDIDLADPPLARVTREASLTVEAKAMLFQNLKALVRGGIRVVQFVMGGEALVQGVGQVPLTEVLYPTWHPSLGLSLSHTAHLVDGRDGRHIPGTDDHYPYDAEWADPSSWGRNHFGVWGDDLFVFEPNLSVEMEQGDPSGAASFVAEGQMIDIGQGRDAAWGHLPSGVNSGEMEYDDPHFLMNPGGHPGDPLNAYNAPVETEGALPFTTGDEGNDALAFEGSLQVEARMAFDVPDASTPEQAADYLANAASERANFVTDLLRRISKAHGCYMDGETFRLKKKKRMLEKIEKAMVKYHLRPDQAAEEFQDALRFTMVLPTVVFGDLAKAVLEELANKGIKPMAPDLVKNYFLRGDPYDGLNTVMRLADGFPFELQFHTAASLDLKMKNHELYEEFRDEDSPPKPERRRWLWNKMVADTYALERPGGLTQVGFPQAHRFAGFSTANGVFYYAFRDTRSPGQYRGVFRRVEEPGDVRFERYSNSARTWVEDNSLAMHLVKGDPFVDPVSEGEALVIVAVTRDMEGQALLDRLVPREASALEEIAHTEALVVEALDTPEMAEVVGQNLTEAPPGPGDARLSWLMGGAPSSNPGAGGDHSPQNASSNDIAQAATAALAKMALKSFSPEEQAEIINEGIDVQASNLADLDIAGTHYEGLEAALREAEEGDEFL